MAFQSDEEPVQNNEEGLFPVLPPIDWCPSEEAYESSAREHSDMEWARNDHGNTCNGSEQLDSEAAWCREVELEAEAGVSLDEASAKY